VAQQLAHAGALVAEAPLPALDFNQDLASAGDLIGMMLGVFQPEPDQPPSTLAQYLAELDRRDQSILVWERFFDQWDVLLCPPSMTIAFPHCATGAPLPVDGQESIYWMVNAQSPSQKQRKLYRIYKTTATIYVSI